MNTEQILLSLTDLRHNLRQAQFPLDLPEAITQAGLARRIANQLNDYILPRLETIDAPLLAVVGGSTGAGKSTLVNSLVGHMVTQPGVIRPTTTSPVLVHDPDDAFWFDGDRVLPTLVRSQVASNDASSLQLVAEPDIPRGLAILDAPAIDSVVTRNRDLAAQLLQAADLWVFVTSAARYADAVPWDFLNEAQERHASIAVVCDRVPVEAMREVPADLGRLLTERGLADSPLFAVPETKTNDAGLLPDQAVAPRLLEALFGDDAVRRLAKAAKIQLDARVEGLLANEVTRYRAVLDSSGVDTELPGRIRASIEESRQAQDAPVPLSDQVTIRTRREDPEVEASQAREIGQVQAEMPVLDAEIVKPAAVLDPEPCQEER